MDNNPVWRNVTDCFNEDLVDSFDIAESYCNINEECDFRLTSKMIAKNLSKLLGIQKMIYPILTVPKSATIDDAIDVFSQIIKKDPQFAEAWNARATTFYMKGDFKNSISDIDQVLLLNADHFGALSGLGSMLEKLEHLDAALDAFKRAEEINPLNLNIKNSILRLLKKVEGISL